MEYNDIDFRRSRSTIKRYLSAYILSMGVIAVLIVVGIWRHDHGIIAAILGMFSLAQLFVLLPMVGKYKAVLGDYEASVERLMAEVEGRRAAEEKLERERLALEDKVAWRTSYFKELNYELNEKVEELNNALDMIVESERRYRAIMENVPDAVLIVDMEAEGGGLPIVDINKSALAMHGYKREELIGKDVSLLQFGKDKITTASLLPRAIAGEYLGPIYFEHVRKDGSALPLEIHVNTVVLDGKKHAVAVERDISDRLAQIDALQQSEDKFRGLVENINDWAWEVDRGFVFTYSSPRVQGILGYRPEEVIGKSPFDLTSEREGNILRVEFGTILSLEKPFINREFICLHKAGHEVVLEASGTPVFGEGGAVIGFRGVSRDITEKKVAVDGLKKLKNAIDNIAEMIAVTDRDGALTYVNSEFMRKNGAAGEVMGRNISEVLPLGDIILQGIRSAVRNNRIWTTSAKSTGADRGHREYEMLISPVSDKDGWVEDCVIVLREVTLEKELGNKLAHSEKLSAIGTFVSGVAHELNNPLMSIVGFSRAIMEDSGDELAPHIKKDIGIVVEEAKRAVNIVKDLLQYSKKPTVSAKSIDINKVVDAALISTHAVFSDGRVKLRRDCRNDALYVFADGIKLQQVFVNVISNANNQIRKATGSGTITVCVQSDGSQVVTDIENDGPSIPEDLIGKIFNPFYTTSETGEGSGLGLFVSAKIISEHNGSLTAENLETGGVRFRITIEAVMDVADGQGALARSLPEVPRPVEMLVIDDNRQIRAWFKDHFGKTNNVAITLSADGADALGAIREHEYDVILSDVKMPVMGGLALKNWLMENRPEYLKRLVIMSGLVDEKVESEARHAGCQFLQKPFEKEELVEVISRIAGGGGGKINITALLSRL